MKGEISCLTRGTALVDFLLGIELLSYHLVATTGHPIAFRPLLLVIHGEELSRKCVLVMQKYNSDPTKGLNTDLVIQVTMDYKHCLLPTPS